ncbi:hypothetical protein ACU4GD_44575 [Cupriavidus basilensis]
MTPTAAARKTQAHAVRVQLPDGRSITVDLSQAADGVLAPAGRALPTTASRPALLVRPDNHDALSVAVTAHARGHHHRHPSHAPVAGTRAAVRRGCQGTARPADAAPRCRPGPSRRAVRRCHADHRSLRRRGRRPQPEPQLPGQGLRDQCPPSFAYAEHESDPVSGDIVLCCPVVEAGSARAEEAAWGALCRI